MTISSTTRIAGPFLSGTALPFTFKVFAAADLEVVRLNTSTGVETSLVLGSDYTVALNGNQNTNPGGTVNLTVAASATSTVTITSDIANLQPTDLTNQGGFYPEVITDALDRATIQIQQMSEDVGRSLKGPISDGNLNMELPTAAQRANSFLAFDANGVPTAVVSGSSGAPTTITRQVFSGTGSQTVFTLASDPGALGNSAQVFIGGVYQQRSTYTIAGTTLTFSQAPVAGSDNIEFVNYLTSSIGATSADLVTYTPSGTSAVARSAASKFGDVISVKDFGAVGDDVANDTAALQAAINAAYAANKALYIPGGKYRFTTLTFAPTDSVSTGQGLRIYGDSTGNGTGGRGTILRTTASSGAAFTINASTGACYVELDGLTFAGNPNVTSGVQFNQNWLAKIKNCVFAGFSNASAKALWFYTSAVSVGYSGSSFVQNCIFQSNSTGIFSGGAASGTPAVNFVQYRDCFFLDHTVAAVQVGASGGPAMQARSHIFNGCGFEGNARDILTYASMYAMSVTGCYFETITPSHTAPRIEIATDGVSAPGESINISECYFQYNNLASGNSIISIAAGSINVKNNHCSNGNQTDRYFLSATHATKSDFEPSTTPPGVTAFPSRISSTSSIGAAKIYTQAVNTELRPEPLASNTANAARIYQGAGSPSNSLGSSGDLYINNAVSGANIESRDAIWQKGSAFWKRVTYLQSIDNISYASVMTPDLAKGSILQITPNNSSGFTIDPVANAGPGQIYSIAIINTTGGALGAATFSTAPGGYKLAGAWTQPANGFRRIVTFYYDPGNLFSYEIARTAADVAN
jgi:hypothetical protein